MMPRERAAGPARGSPTSSSPATPASPSFETFDSRPADHPGARPGPARGGELPLLRRPGRRPARRRLQGARHAAELRQPQADRRRRAHHPVEHAVHARVLEARPGARVRLHGRAQARRVHPAVGVAVGGHLRGGRLPTGVFNLVNGLGEEAGDALVKHPDVPLISFTGESPAPDRSSSRNCAEHLKAPVDGARAASRPRSCSPTPTSSRGDRLDDVRRVLAQRRALHRGQPHPRRAGDLRRVRRALRRAGGAGSWSATRTTRRPRSGRSCTPSTTRRSCATSRSARPRAGWSRAAAGRTGCRRQLRGADRLRRRAAGRPDLPGGDLRPGRRDHPVRHRRGGAEAGQRHAVRPRRLHLDQRPHARAHVRAVRRGRAWSG